MDNQSVTQLPKFETQPTHTLASKYPIVVSTLNFLILSLLTIIAFVVNHVLEIIESPWFFIPSGLTVLISISVWLQAQNKFYSIREQDITFYKGVLFQSTIVQPFIRLQHIEIEVGPIERWFKLATLKLYSAGGASHTMSIPGLPVETANRLKQFILEHKGDQHAG